MSPLPAIHETSWHCLVVDGERTTSAAIIQSEVRVAVQPPNRGSANRAGGDMSGKVDLPKKPRLQLYTPPAMKEKRTAVYSLITCTDAKIHTFSTANLSFSRGLRITD